MECTDPNACALDGTALVERIADWREVSAQATSRTVGDERIVSTYPPEARLLRRLRDLIAAEAECCVFLKFTIKEEEGQTIVELAFPPGARALVEAVITEPVAST